MDSREVNQICSAIEEVYPVRSLQDAWAVPSITLGKLNRNEASMFVALKTIARIENYFGDSNKLSVDQAKILGELVCEEYSGLKINEVDLVFRKAVKGEYGKTYNNLDVALIMSWFAQYASESGEFFALRREEKHKRDKDAKVESTGMTLREWRKKKGITDEQWEEMNTIKKKRRSEAEMIAAAQKKRAELEKTYEVLMQMQELKK